MAAELQNGLRGPCPCIILKTVNMVDFSPDWVSIYDTADFEIESYLGGHDLIIGAL